MQAWEMRLSSQRNKISVMSDLVKKPTNCHFCGYLCAFIATVEHGRVVDLEPDPSRYPYDESIVRGCRRWRTNLEFIDAGTRINYPLKRVGERGGGQWERISWDEAITSISEELKALIKAYGPETLASAIGGPHASFWPLHRFMNLIGSPNNMGIGQICWNPRIWMDVLSFGWTVEADMRADITEAIVLWGTNPAQSDNSAFWRSLRAFSQQGIPFIVIDPRYTQTARLAELWLPIKPGTDCVLALSLIHVIIREGLVDEDFVETWCHGFDELKAHVCDFTPERAAQICGLKAEDIEKAAILFGKARASVLVSGRGLDQIGPDVAPTHRAVCCLRAITGNLDKPGSCILTETSDFEPEVSLEMSHRLSQEQRDLCLNTKYSPLQCYSGYDHLAKLTTKHGRELPLRYMTSAHPDLVLRAMETGEPYPVRALIVQATNPLLTYADTHRVYKALMSLDLLVVPEYSMTPTAAIADYVLPIAGAIERPVMQIHGGVANMAYGGPAAVDPYYERKTDYDFFRELGLRFGQEEEWPYATLEEAYGASLEPVGLDWDSFSSSGFYWRQPGSLKHEQRDATGKARGFATKTGLVELASETLPELGGQRLPMPSSRFWPQTEEEIPVLAAEEVSSERNVPDLPSEKHDAVVDELTLITGARKQPYNASVFLDNALFRELYPHPLAEMSENTARYYGLVAGDEILVKTEKGQALFWVKIIKMRDGVLSVDYGWWYPEQPLKLPELGGIWQSNVNTLTDCSIDSGEEMIGTWSYNAISCHIEKVDKEEA